MAVRYVYAYLFVSFIRIVSVRMNRITTIVGAGAVLDLGIPNSATRPSTENITNAIRGIKIQNVLTHKAIVEIEEIYQILKKDYPAYPSFELIFHVLEMFMAYGWVWQHPTAMPKTTAMFPVFAPFTAPKWLFDRDNVNQALDSVLLTIMDIVNGYNEPYLAGTDKNMWYRCFWKDYVGSWDIFSLNYDTTIEHTLDLYEDGFEDIPYQPEFQHFVPQKLWENNNGGSTISHLHGCIEYFDGRYNNEVYKKEVLKYGFHDLYKYGSYNKVRKMYNGSGKSKPSNQAGEQFINTPIITGLLKTDKLNILPFAFYHSHLYNCVMRSNSLLVIGYSFGDLYINQLLERMELIYGDKKRVVLIDYWKLNKDDKEIEKISEGEERSSFVESLMADKVHINEISDGLGTFLCRMTGETEFGDAISSFEHYDHKGPMVSNNGCLMLFIGGFKAATQYKNDIYNFLNS